MSELSFIATIDRTKWKSDIDAIRRDLLGLNTTVQGETQKMDSSFKNLSLGIAGYFSASVLKGFTMELINVRGEFQKTEIAFTTMLGNADKAKELMGQMVDLAAKTPFSLQDVSNGAKQLLAFQVPANEVVDTLTRMGNIAAGLGVPLSRINLVYGQVKAKGKLAGDDLRQFTEAGIPMVAELAKKFNTSTSAISEMVSAGKIGFKDVQDVLFSLTNEGGMFFNLMEKQSASLSGKIANLGDSWDQMLNKIGESNEGVLAGGIDGLNTLVEHYEDILDILTVLIATYGAYRAALIATVAIQSASTIAGNIQAFFQLASSIRSAKDAQILFNTVTKANPYVIAATALAALGTALYVYTNNLSDAEKAQQELNAEIARQQAPLVSTKTKIDSLVSAIKNENSTNAQRAEWLKQIKTLSNGRLEQLTVEQIRTGKATSAINDYIKQLYKEAEAKAYLQRITDLSDKREQLRAKTKTGLSAGDLWDDMTDLKTSHQGSTKDRRNRRLINEINSVSGEIQKAREKFNQITKEGFNTTEIIKESTVAETEKKSTKLKKEVEKIYSENTLKGLEQRIQKYKDIMEKSVINSNTYNSAKSKMEGYQKQLDDLTKQLQKKSFDEQMSETKRQIDVRDKLLSQGYSQEVVNAMFPEVKDKSFEKYLNDTQVSLKKLIESGKGTEETANNLSLITDELEKWKGYDTYIEGVTKSIDNLKSRYKGGELITKLENYGNSNIGNETENEKNAKKLAVQKTIQDLELEWQKYYQSFLNDQQSFEDKSVEIQERYAKLKADIINDNNLSPQQSSNALIQAGQQEAEEYTRAFIDGITKDPKYRQAFVDMERQSIASLKQMRVKLKKALDEYANSTHKTPEGIKELQDSLDSLDQRINSSNMFEKLISDLNRVGDASLSAADRAQALNSIGDSMMNVAGNVGGAIDDISGMVEDLGGNLDNEFGDVLDKLSNYMKGVQQQAQGIKEVAQGILTGNPVQVVTGVVKAIAGQVKSIAALFNNDRKKERHIKQWAGEVENLKNKYEDLQRTINKALGEDSYKQQQAAVANLRQQQALLQSMINEERKKKKTDNGKINEWQNQINQINGQIEDIYDNISQQISGTNAKDMASQLADALIEAYGKGESAAEAYGKVADDVMKNAVKNALKMQLLEKPMQDMIKQLIKNMGFNQDGTGSFDGLTEEERNQIKAMMQNASQNYMSALGAYEDLFGAAATDASSLEGAIKGVSEETASLIAGQMNAIRIVQAQMLENSNISIDVLRNSLLQLTQIEINTRFLRLIYLEVSKNNNDGGIRAKGLI